MHGRERIVVQIKKKKKKWCRKCVCACVYIYMFCVCEREIDRRSMMVKMHENRKAELKYKINKKNKRNI